MKITNIKTQVSFFSDMSRIKADASTISKIFTHLAPLELIPSTLEQRFPDRPPLSRPVFKNAPKNLTVQMLVERLDIIQGYSAPEQPAIEIDELENTVRNIAVPLMEFDSFRFNRLSYIQEYLVSEINLEDLESSLFKFTNPISASPLKEWSLRTCVESKTSINNVEEILNNIFTFEKAQVAMHRDNRIEEFNGLHVVLDINTIGENKSPRFGLEEISEFIKSIAGNKQSLESLLN